LIFVGSDLAFTKKEIVRIRKEEDMGAKVVSRKNQIRGILFVMFLMAITVAVILKDYSVSELIKAIKSANPVFLLTGILMMFLYVGCQAMNFYIIMRRLGQSAPYSRCIQYAYIGNYFGGITPGASGGQPAQVYYMSKDDIHVDLSAITIFFMVFASQIVILLIGFTFAALRLPMVIQFAEWLKYLLIAGSIVMIGLTLILTAFMFMGKTIPCLVHLGLKLAVRLHLIKNPEVVKSKLDQIKLDYKNKRSAAEQERTNNYSDKISSEDQDRDSYFNSRITYITAELQKRNEEQLGLINTQYTKDVEKIAVYRYKPFITIP
jgi:uncharacterized membrane protein YbhN (UPF0104 family)